VRNKAAVCVRDQLLLSTRWVPALVALLLAACATTAPGSRLPAISNDPQTHQQQRDLALAAIRVWSLAGRVAVSNGKDGGSGRIDWQQDGDRYQVALSAPVTRQSWRLSGTPDQARLDGLEGGPRHGPNAAALLLAATRWEIPVEALTFWVRGRAADHRRFGVAEFRFSEDGRVAQLSQGEWVIVYQDWRPTGQGLELPHRLTALRDSARVRLIVDQWQ